MADSNVETLCTFYDRDYFRFSALKRFHFRMRPVTAAEASPHPIFYSLRTSFTAFNETL